MLDNLIIASGTNGREIFPKEPTLIVGKNDKTIGISENGKFINFAPFALLSENGYMKFPMSGEDAAKNKYDTMYVQWGKAVIQAGESTEFSFPVAFPNRNLQIIGSHDSNDPISSLSIATVDKTKFRVTISGGMASEVVSWLAFGY